MILLGIESSCDDTAVAIVENGRHILASCVSSQNEIHKKYGGVVPELASRRHIESILPVVQEAFDTAQMVPNQIDGICVTQGPGLIGSLLVGFSFAKALSCSLNIPWVGVNHLEGHISSIFLSQNPPTFPFISLLVSGGHTSIYDVKSQSEIALLGHTLDDAAGEAFDKVSKMLGLGYPGGRVIDQLSLQGNPKELNFPRSFLKKNEFDFSFSGVKTAVNRYIQTHPDKLNDDYTPHIAASFQEAVVDVLVKKTLKAAIAKNYKQVCVVGGVAANSRLRAQMREHAEKKGIRVFLPPIALCGDNAAMIAVRGYYLLQSGHIGQFNDDAFARALRKPIIFPSSKTGSKK